MTHRLFAAMTLIVLAACGDSTEPTTASLAGTWTLQSVNDATLPATVNGSGANRSDVTKGSVILVATGNYTQSVEIVTYVSGQASTMPLNDAGTFTVSGSTITFTSTGGSTQTATVSGNSMTVVAAGATAIYVR